MHKILVSLDLMEIETSICVMRYNVVTKKLRQDTLNNKLDNVCFLFGQEKTYFYTKSVHIIFMNY